METTWIKELSARIEQNQCCIKHNNVKWRDISDRKISELIDMLPHGSGIDSDWEIDTYKNRHKITLYNSYHAMNENGYYDGWIDFTVTITPSFQGVELLILGRFGKYQYIEEYLYDILGCGIEAKILYNEETDSYSFVK